MPSLTIQTLGQVIDAGWRAFASCSACSCCEELQPRTLLWSKGRGMPLDMLPERLRNVRGAFGAGDLDITDVTAA